MSFKSLKNSIFNFHYFNIKHKNLYLESVQTRHMTYENEFDDTKGWGVGGCCFIFYVVPPHFTSKSLPSFSIPHN